MVKHRLMLPILAVIVGIAASAFTKSYSVNAKVRKAAINAKANQQWFVYTDGTDDIASTLAEARNTDNYMPEGQNPQGCQGSDNLCAIFTDTDSNGKPVINQNQGVDLQLQAYFNSSGTNVGNQLIEKP